MLPLLVSKKDTFCIKLSKKVDMQLKKQNKTNVYLNLCYIRINKISEKTLYLQLYKII